MKRWDLICSGLSTLNARVYEKMRSDLHARVHMKRWNLTCSSFYIYIYQRQKHWHFCMWLRGGHIPWGKTYHMKLIVWKPKSILAKPTSEVTTLIITCVNLVMDALVGRTAVTSHQLHQDGRPDQPVQPSHCCGLYPHARTAINCGLY